MSVTIFLFASPLGYSVAAWHGVHRRGMQRVAWHPFADGLRVDSQQRGLNLHAPALHSMSMDSAKGNLPAPAGGARRKQILIIIGAAAAGVSAVGGTPRSACLQIVRCGLLLAPVVSVVRLCRNGKRQAALRLALLLAARRFCSRWWQYLTIPLFAGMVGWLTNKVAVDMIFYPLEFGGPPHPPPSYEHKTTSHT